MQNFLIDFIPVLAFLAAFKLYGIYVATTVGIVMTGLQVILTRWLRKAYDKQQLITLAVFVVFGGMTLYFHNPIFIKWKPTIIFWVFALVFLGSHFIGKKPIAQKLLEHMVSEPTHPVPSIVWKKLNVLWMVFFTGLGALNIYIAYHFSTDTWVNFKVYGIMGLLIVFSLFQAVFLSRYITDSK